MTTTNWVTRVVCALLAMAMLLGSLLALGEIAAAALGRAPVLVPHAEWTRWLRTHDWNDGIVITVLGGLVLVGLLLLLLALRRGKPRSLALRGRTEGVDVIASRRSVERSLAAAATRSAGITTAAASVSRRTARVRARTGARSEPGIREEVETAVSGRLESLDLNRPLRTRVDLVVENKR